MKPLLTFAENLPLSLYIHLPWCVKKCPYCDFNSYESDAVELNEDVYVDALIRDLETELPGIWGRPVGSIFLGGGTPSLFSAAALDRLLSAIRARLTVYPDIEITLEANPGTAEAEKFRAYKALGVNRLSLGVQSFNDKHLKSLGRIHSADEAVDAIELAKRAGFENFNLDIMYGLPEQTIEQALAELELACSYKPTHLSWYQLTVEPNTVFYARPPALPVDETLWAIQTGGQSLLAEQGYAQYEISAYARHNRRCRHNLNYWEFGDYLGIGAGAHSKLTDIVNHDVTRLVRHKIPARYIELAGDDAVVTKKTFLGHDDLVLEFMMNSMRLVDGVASGLFTARTGRPITLIKDLLVKAEERGFIIRSPTRLAPTNRGLHYLNEFLQLFINERAEPVCL